MLFHQARYELTDEHWALSIIDQVNGAMRKWKQFANTAGCTKKATRDIVLKLKAV